MSIRKSSYCKKYRNLAKAYCIKNLKEVQFALRNWHMEKYFGEHKMNLIGDVLCVAMLVIGLGYMIATLVSLMGGIA